jgi:hypothetical protein
MVFFVVDPSANSITATDRRTDEPVATSQVRLPAETRRRITRLAHAKGVDPDRVATRLVEYALLHHENVEL